jgi:hypothetical protein
MRHDPLSPLADDELAGLAGLSVGMPKDGMPDIAAASRRDGS